MKKFYALLIILSLFSSYAFTQTKQGNTVNAEIYADAPYRMKIRNENGELNPIPIHIFAHDADGTGANIELMSIDIYIKNASDKDYTRLITFDNYSDTEFNSLFIQKSPNNSDLGIQDFESSEYEKSPEHTIVFRETQDFWDRNYYVEIDHKFWYFTFLIPAEKLAGYDDIIDIKVYFNIDWSVDDETNLRIFRYDNDLPKITNWYRGDMHYHTIFTQNIAETGEALDATKLMARLTGMDWQFVTDHSCDFDNYGTSMSDNWNTLGEQIAQLNAQDTNYILIRGIEMSIKSNGGKIIHALTYPSEKAPFSMPYLGDGGGDYSSTGVTTDMLLSAVDYYDGMVFAAHPFAEKDKLPDLINGSVWNLSDPDFLTNGSAAPSNGTIICNDLSIPSDVFSKEPGKLFKDGLYGFQIWNLYNSLTTSSRDNFGNPYNATYDDIPEFTQLSTDDPNHHLYRLQQNFDVVKYLWQKALKAKNANDALENWKTFIVAGSDAHGSFNFSNTDIYFAIYGSIEDNAIGRLSTLVYLPDGKGSNGENIIAALKKGHAVLSDGPVIAYTLTGANNTYTCGDDIVITENELSDYTFNIYSSTTPEFGDKTKILMYVGTEDGEKAYLLYLYDLMQYNLSYLLNAVFDNDIPVGKYFYIRFALETHKDYGALADIYKKTEEYFYSFTNPIWFKVTDNTTKAAYSSLDDSATEIKTIYKDYEIEITHPNTYDFVSLVNLSGQEFYGKATKQNDRTIINTDNLQPGIYLVKFLDKEHNKVISKKIIVQ